MSFFLSHSDVLVSVLEACDKALDHASGSRKKRNQHTDLEIERAIKKLLAYEHEKRLGAE